MYRGFFVVVNGHTSLPHPLPCHMTFHVLLKGTLVVSRVCACPCSAAAPLAALCLAAPLPRRWVPLSLPPVHPRASPPGAVLRGLGLLGIPPAYWGSASFPSGLCPFPLAGQGLPWGCGSPSETCPGTQDHQSFKLLPHRPRRHPAVLARAWVACPPSGLCMAEESQAERAGVVVGPGSGQVEERGHPRAPQVVPTRQGRGSPQACAGSSMPRPSGACQATILFPPLPSARCLCLLCTPTAWAAVSASPSFLPSLLLFPPAHVGSRPPGCELLGGRPSINVKCCCPPLLSGPCLHLPGSPRALASPFKPKHLSTPGLLPSPPQPGLGQ